MDNFNEVLIDPQQMNGERLLPFPPGPGYRPPYQPYYPPYQPYYPYQPYQPYPPLWWLAPFILPHRPYYPRPRRW